MQRQRTSIYSLLLLKFFGQDVTTVALKERNLERSLCYQPIENQIHSNIS